MQRQIYINQDNASDGLKSQMGDAEQEVIRMEEGVIEATARQREEMEISVIIGTNNRMERSEENSFKRSVELGKVRGVVYSTCNQCQHENNMTLNKSTFCSQCGTLLTDRHY